MVECIVITWCDFISIQSYSDCYVVAWMVVLFKHSIQLKYNSNCCRITHGRVFNGQLYACRFQNLIYLCLFTELFHEDFASIVRRNTGGFTQRYTWYIRLGEERGWVEVHRLFWEGLGRVWGLTLVQIWFPCFQKDLSYLYYETMFLVWKATQVIQHLEYDFLWVSSRTHEEEIGFIFI